ncbi:MAG: hypothetical protein ACREA2_21905 [Blastocatellia bacterium]
MIATPTALNLANNPAPASGPVAQIAPASHVSSTLGSRSKSARTDTGISSPVKAGKQKAKPKSEAKPKKPRLPKDRRRARPPNVAGYTWRKDGAGWELRKSVYVVSDTGIRKRRLPYVAHLSKSAFGELKRQHKGAALSSALAEWIAEHDR